MSEKLGSYDSDVSSVVVSRVQAEADKILSCEKWVVIDGMVGRRRRKKNLPPIENAEDRGTP